MGLGLVLVAALSACGDDGGGGEIDSGLGACEGARTDEACEGSQPPPNDDASTDERAPDGGETREDAGDQLDAMQVDESDAASDEHEDASVDEGVELEPDASVEPDATVEPAPNCRDDYECGYGECDEAEAPPNCDCVIGYRDDGAGCVWAGDGESAGVVDSTLDDPSAWSGSRFTIADGVAKFQATGTGESCDVGVMQQELLMPSRAVSQAFVVELDVLSSCNNADAEECPALQLELGTSATRLVVAGAAGAAAAPVARTVSACVGQAGYGAEVMLRVRPSLTYRRGELPLSCETASWPAIDRIAIRPAAASECAADDALLGTLASSAGWSLSGATIASHRMTLPVGTRAETMVAFSEAASSQALRFRTNASGGGIPQQVVAFSLDGLTWAHVRAASDVTICMPQWAAGAGHRLAIESIAGEVLLNDLAIVDAPQCGDNAFDAFFDRPVIGSSWSTSTGLFGVNTGFEGPGMVVVGSSALLASFRFPAREVYRFALHMLYRNGMNQSSILDFNLDSSAAFAESSGAWKERFMCLPSRFEHQLATLRVDVAMTPNMVGGQTTMGFDDLGLRFPSDQDCD